MNRLNGFFTVMTQCGIDIWQIGFKYTYWSYMPDEVDKPVHYQAEVTCK